MFRLVGGDIVVRPIVAVSLLLMSAHFAFAGIQDTVPSLVEELVRKLRDPDFRVREKAGEALWRLGAAAEPALRQAAKAADAETAERAKEILSRFDAGNYPDTPPEVSALLRDMRSPNFPKQIAAFRSLVRIGPKAMPGLRAALRSDMGKDVRPHFFQEVLRVLREEVPLRLAAGDDDGALDLLTLHSYGPVHEGLLDYVVELERRGRLDAAARELESRGAPAEATQAARRTLIFIRRAQGKHDAAVKDAEAIERNDAGFQPVVDGLLEDRRDWKSLATRATPNANSFEGLKAFRLRNAGRTAEADAILDAQVESETRDIQRNGSVDSATLALLMNDRTDDGLKRMATMRNSPQILADIQAAKMRFRDALSLLAVDDGKDEAVDAFTAPLAVIRRARILHQLGDRDRAGKLFDGIAAAPPGPDGFRIDVLTQLIRAEVRCGRYDQAAAHFGTVTQLGTDGRRMGQDGYELLFEGDSEAAQSLWWLYAEESRISGGAVMLKIRRLVRGTASAEEFREANAKFATLPPGMSPLARANAQATVQLAAGKSDEAMRTLTAAADQVPAPKPGVPAIPAATQASRAWVFGTDESFRFWMDLADLLHDRGDDRAALRYLGQGLLHHPGQPILLYLSARSQRRLGHTAEADRLLAVSHRVPLGNTRLRGRFLEELLNRGDAAEAKVEAEQVLRSAWLMETFIGNVWNQVGRTAVLNKDFAAARFAYAKAIHYLLRTPGIAYVEGTGYFSVPMNLKVYSVRELLAAGKVDEAVAQAKAVIAESPASTDMVIAVVPKLEALGRKADADALYEASSNGFRKLLEEYPSCSWAAAQAAWLAAGCRRELDAALTDASSAFEREPHIRLHREVLAEVLFRRGKRAEAAELMRGLIRDARRNIVFRRQLDRYLNGDVTSPLPDMDD